MIKDNNYAWKYWFDHTEEIRAEAAGMSKEELIEKLLSYEQIETEKQKKVYVKKLKRMKTDKLVDLWIEREYTKIHS